MNALATLAATLIYALVMVHAALISHRQRETPVRVPARTKPNPCLIEILVTQCTCSAFLRLLKSKQPVQKASNSSIASKMTAAMRSSGR